MPIDLPADIVPLDEFTESINLLLYAEPGVGKTIFAAKARTLILATEYGTISAARQAKKVRGFEHTKVWNCVGSWTEFEKAHDWIRDNHEDPDFPFDWISIDTVTEAQRLIMLDLAAEDAATDDSRNIDHFEIQEYGEQQNRLKRFVNQFNDMDVNICWLAHAMPATNEEGVEFKLPNIHGQGYQLSAWVAAQQHVVGYMSLDTAISSTTKKEITVRRTQWQKSEQVWAKDRFDCLGKSTLNKSLAQITKMIEDSAGTDDPEPPKKAPAKKAPAKATAPAPA